MPEESKLNPEQLPKEWVEESDVYRALVVREPTWRERTASWVAYTVLLFFGGSLLIGFGLGFYILTRLLACTPGSPPDEKAVNASLEYVKTVGGIFTPLLAFILGYYFTKKEE